MIVSGINGDCYISEDGILPENSSAIQERFIKAVSYFLTQTTNNIKKPLEAISFSTDNKAVKKDFSKQFDSLQEKLEEKLFAFQKMTAGFKVQPYLETRAKAVLQKTTPTKKPALDFHNRGKGPVGDRQTVICACTTTTTFSLYQKQFDFVSRN